MIKKGYKSLKNIELDIRKLPLEKVEKYYGEITLGFSMKSKMEFYELCQLLNGQGMRAEMNFKMLNGDKHETEVLEIYDIEWEKDDE